MVRKSFTLLELIISIGIFMQIMAVVFGTMISAMRFNEQNKAMKVVNFEIYNTVINGIGPYIRKATGIKYKADIENGVDQKNGTIYGISGDPTKEVCNDENEFKSNEFGRLTLYQDRLKSQYIIFAVEKKDENSRLVYKKNDGPGYYLTSDDVFITCFLVHVPENPYKKNAHMNLKDIQPYVEIQLAGRYKYEDGGGTKKSVFPGAHTFMSYKTTFTLRNYYY